MKQFIKDGKYFFYAISIFVIGSCSKQQMLASPQHVNYELAAKNEAQKFTNRNVFGVALAKSITKSESLRTLIKNMASEKFDGIADILYCDIENKTVDGVTVNDYIKQFADDKNIFQTAVNQSPLLTIYVPTLPQDWNVRNWNEKTDIPKIAIEKNYNDPQNVINFYNGDGQMNALSDTLIPGFATLVVKENSRICTKDYADIIERVYDKGSDFPVSYEQINGQELFFLSAKLKNPIPQLANIRPSGSTGTAGSRTSAQYAGLETSTPDVVTAYNQLGTAWPRDYIYYGLTPTTSTGPLNNRNAERITYFSFASNAILSQITTEPTDPQQVTIKSNPNDANWTSGSYHITFTILNNAKNGTGQTFQKSAFLTPDQVWATTYQLYQPLHFSSSYDRWFLASTTPKTAVINIDLVPFDIGNYSTAWKITVEDTRPTTVLTYQTTYSSQFAENFALDNSVGLLKKIGLKLGASATQTSTENHTVTTTLTSLSLGDIILNYSDPVITSTGTLSFLGTNITTYNTLDYSTGSGSVILSIVPWPQW